MDARVADVEERTYLAHVAFVRLLMIDAVGKATASTGAEFVLGLSEEYPAFPLPL